MHHVVYKNQHEHTNTNLNTISVIQLEMTFDLYGMGNSIYGGGREAFQYLYKKGPSLTHRNNGKKFIDHRKKKYLFFLLENRTLKIKQQSTGIFFHFFVFVMNLNTEMGREKNRVQWPKLIVIFNCFPLHELSFVQATQKKNTEKIITDELSSNNNRLNYAVEQLHAAAARGGGFLSLFVFSHS